MAHEENTQVVSAVATADIDVGNRFVTMANTGKIGLSAANALSYGVLTNPVKADVAGRVVTGGVVPIEVGAGGVTAGTPVGAGADGVAVTAATTKLAIPLETGAAGEIVSFKLLLTATAGA